MLNVFHRLRCRATRKPVRRHTRTLTIERLEKRCVPSTTISEFGGLTPNSFPQGITLGPDGKLWFTEHNASQIGRISTAGVITAADEFPIPNGTYLPGAIAAGTDGNLWFTENGAPQEKIGRITTAGVITPADEFLLPPGAALV